MVTVFALGCGEGKTANGGEGGDDSALGAGGPDAGAGGPAAGPHHGPHGGSHLHDDDDGREDGETREEAAARREARNNTAKTRANALTRCLYTRSAATATLCVCGVHANVLG